MPTDAPKGLTTRQRALYGALCAGRDGPLTDELLAAAGLGADGRDSLRALERRKIVTVARDAHGDARVWLRESDDAPWPRPPAVAPPPPGAHQGFRERTDAAYRLIVPRASKRGWSDAERPWRSLVVDRHGRVVSSGYPKFFVWGEHKGDTARVRRALVRGEPAQVREKLDGSLVIRSVVAGEVWLRTRGTFDGGLLGDDLRAHVADAHPQLLDPARAPEVSVLFEFRHPAHPAVLPVSSPSLTLLDVVDHGWPPRLASPAHRAVVAERLGMTPLAPVGDLPEDPKRLRALVEGWWEREGVVIGAGSCLVKLKSRDYRDRQQARLSVSPDRIAEIAAEHGVSDEQELFDALVDEGITPEVARTLGPTWRHQRMGPR